MASSSEGGGAPTEQITQAESAIERMQPGYLERVRTSAARLGVQGASADRVRDAIMELEEIAQVDIEPPTYSSQPLGRAIKGVIKKSVQWYFRYVATQVSALGEAAHNLGMALADRVDDVERSNRDLELRVDELDRRIQSIERTRDRSNAT